MNEMRQITTQLDLSIKRSGAQWLVTPHTPRAHSWIADNLSLPEGISHDDGLVLNRWSVSDVVENANDAGLVIRLGW